MFFEFVSRSDTQTQKRWALPNVWNSEQSDYRKKLRGGRLLRVLTGWGDSRWELFTPVSCWEL